MCSQKYILLQKYQNQPLCSQSLHRHRQGISHIEYVYQGKAARTKAALFHITKAVLQERDIGFPTAPLRSTE